MKKQKFILIAILIIVLTLSAYYLYTSQDKSSELSIIFLGDTAFGESYNTGILEQYGYDYSLENFNSMLEDSDLVIANLETPITNFSTPAYPEKEYNHYSSPEYAGKALSDHNIKLVSLANNHLMDFGTPGLEDTIKNLQENNIIFTGAGLNEEKAIQPTIINFELKNKTFSLALISGFEFQETYNEYQFYSLNEAPGVLNLESPHIPLIMQEIKSSSPDTFLIIFPHWGENYNWKTGKQQETAQKLVQAGADMIIGHGAHTLQEIEKINNTTVIYSLGNFVFLSPGRYSASETPPYSLITRMIIKEDLVEFRLYPIKSDNLETNYQPGFASKKEVESIKETLIEKSPQLSLVIKKDKYGYYLTL
ncbi:MAG: CapA family protein [archaeon]